MASKAWPLSIAGLAFSALLAALSGCQDTNIADAAGAYQGFVVTENAGIRSQATISGSISKVSDTELSVNTKTVPEGQEADFDVVIFSPTEIHVTESVAGTARKVDLSPGDDGCFADTAKTDRVCYDGTELSIQAQDGSGSRQYLLDRESSASPSPAPTLEAPQNYAIDDLLARSETRNFSTRAQFESVLQAKYTAQGAYLNLLPHINVGSALDLVGFVTLTMVRAVGDLVPFVLPDRWFQAAADNDTARAQFDSYRALQGNGMNVVQGLALSVLRDEQVLYALEQNRLQITEVRDEIQYAEQGGGTVQVGASEDVTSELTTLLMSIDALKETIHEEKVALAQGAGFVNPVAVTAVEPIAMPKIQTGIAASENDLETMAVRRSIELIQMDDLIAAARETKKASYFQWLDPTGDDNGGIGFGIKDYVEIDASAIDQLYAQKQGTESTIRGNVLNAYNQSGELASRFLLAIQESSGAADRIARLRSNFESGQQIEMADLVSALHDKAQGDTDQVNAQFAYLTVLAQMDRLTLSGAYAPLSTEPSP